MLFVHFDCDVVQYYKETFLQLLIQKLLEEAMWWHESGTYNRGRTFVEFSLANLNQHGWPLVKLYTFQSPDKEFLYMLRRSDDMVRDPMDAIVMPKKWHHLCVAIDGTTNTVRGVSVSI